MVTRMKCLECEKILVGRQRKYCSICHKHRYLHRKNWRKRQPILKCIRCGKSYQSTSGLRQKYCGITCASLASRKYLDIPDVLEKSNRKLDKNIGYVRIYAPMHPEANTWGYVYEHRLIAEQIIGRRLKHGEVVHHKNGKRWDNTPENLDVMNNREHSALNKRGVGELVLPPFL